MGEQIVQLTRDRAQLPTLRDVVAIGFRQRWLMILCFAGIFLGTVMAIVLSPAKYPGHMKILVKRERVDPKITAETTALPGGGVTAASVSRPSGGNTAWNGVISRKCCMPQSASASTACPSARPSSVRWYSKRSGC